MANDVRRFVMRTNELFVRSETLGVDIRIHNREIYDPMRILPKYPVLSRY